MPKTSAPEWLLARITDPTRAAAILGDLLELSATRSRVWFWTAYARTLISLGWRTPVAFVFAIASMKFMFRIAFPWLAHATIGHLGDAGLLGEQNRIVDMVLWNISMVIGQCLCFLLPYVALRFGLRSRLTQLACALLVIALPVYTELPWVRDLSGVLIVLAIIAAIVFGPWRRPLFVLAATGVAAIAVEVVSTFSLALVFHWNFLRLSSATHALCDVISFAIAVSVCLNLHRLLLRRRSAAA
jgi:hypothetical protein